jgi:hypothetical protein
MKWMDRTERNKHLRKVAKEQLRMHQQLGDLLEGMRIQKTDDHNCCAFCYSQHGQFIPIHRCTLKALPPFEQCTNEVEGCRCMFLPVLKGDVLDVLPLQ